MPGTEKNTDMVETTRLAWFLKGGNHELLMEVLGFSDLFENSESPKTPKCMNSCGLDMSNFMWVDILVVECLKMTM